MKNLLTPPAEATEIVRRLQESGYETLFCGGCVRDTLLGRTPKDYDIATSAEPAEVERLFPKTIPVGRAFGVILVEGTQGGHYEVATFRSDLEYIDGRRPEGVHFSTAREDASRRDFTINALFYDPFEKRIIDYVNGEADIKARILRTVGDPEQRFREDHLRLLRAARFAARTGFAIDPPTWEKLRDLSALVKTVSPERIAAELETMLTGNRAEASFDLLKRSGLLRQTLPEVDALEGVEQPPDFHPEGDAWTHTLMLLRENDQAAAGKAAPPDFSGIADVDAERGMQRGHFTGEQYAAAVSECRAAMSDTQGLALAWAALLHDIGKPGTLTREDRIRFNDHDRVGAEMAVMALERLRRPRRTIDRVYDLVRRHMHFATLRKMRKSKLRRWLGEADFPLHLELHRMDCMASHAMLANWFFGVEEWREELARPPVVEPLLRGSDLLALGLRPGPRVGELLRRLEDARLEGEVGTREEALALAGRWLVGLEATDGAGIRRDRP